MLWNRNCISKMHDGIAAFCGTYCCGVTWCTHTFLALVCSVTLTYNLWYAKIACWGSASFSVTLLTILTNQPIIPAVAIALRFSAVRVLNSSNHNAGRCYGKLSHSQSSVNMKYQILQLLCYFILHVKVLSGQNLPFGYYI